MKATGKQIRELANTIATQADALAHSSAADTPDDLIRAAVTRLEGNVATLKAWTAE